MSPALLAAFAALTLAPPPEAPAADAPPPTEPPTARQDGHRLDPRFTLGQPYAVAWRLRFDAEAMDLGVPGVPATTQTYRLVTGSAKIGVDANERGLPRFTVAFGPGVRTQPNESGLPGAAKLSEAKVFYDRRTVVSAVEADPFTGQGRMGRWMEDEAEAQAATAQLAASLTHASLFDDRPVRVGHAWTVEDPAPLFGHGSTGTLRLRLDEVDEAADATLARVSVRGEVEVGLAHAAGIGTLKAEVETGGLVINTGNGRVVAADLEGPATLKHGLATLRGRFTYQRRLGGFDGPAATGDAVGPDGDRPKVVQDRQGMYSVTVPGGWVGGDTELGGWLAHGEHQTPDDRMQPVCRVMIMAVPVHATDDLAGYVDRWADAIAAGPGVKLTEQTATQVGGRPGFACVFTRPGTGPRGEDRPRRVLTLFTRVGRTPIHFEAVVAADLFPEVQDDLKAIRRSFTVHDPPRRPDAEQAPAGGGVTDPDADDRRDAPQPDGRAVGTSLADW